MAPRGSRDRPQATKAFLNAFAQDNLDFGWTDPKRSFSFHRDRPFGTQLVNTSWRQECITLHTTFPADGSLFHYFTVAPESDAAAFLETFFQVGASIHHTDLR